MKTILKCTLWERDTTATTAVQRAGLFLEINTPGSTCKKGKKQYGDWKSLANDESRQENTTEGFVAGLRLGFESTDSARNNLILN